MDVRGRLSRIILLLASVSLFFACRQPVAPENEPHSIRISVRVSGDFGDSQLYLRELEARTIRTLDSAETGRSDSCMFVVAASDLGFYLVQVGRRQAVLLAGPGEDISLSFDINDTLKPYHVTGSPGSGLILNYQTITNRNQRKVDSLGYLFRKASAEEDFASRKAALDKAYQDILDDQRAMVMNMLIANPESVAMLYIMNQRFGPNVVVSDSNLLRWLDSTLMLKYPGNKHVLENHKMLLLKAQLRPEQGG